MMKDEGEGGGSPLFVIEWGFYDVLMCGRR